MEKEQKEENDGNDRGDESREERRDHSTNHFASSGTNKANGQTVAEVLSKHEKNMKVNL